jgi:uncharacterized protein YjbI with pentapeptide repeats
MAVAVMAALGIGTAEASPQAVVQLLDQRRCAGCRLQGADLVQAQLQEVDLRKAQLERANLSGAQLDGANLAGATLHYTSLHGASLRGSDLRGASMMGADLRDADLTGALLDPAGLSQAHWQRAKGIQPSSLSYAELHNAGTAAAQQGRYPEAEVWFNEAIRRNPEAAISWLARGISRNEQGKSQLAAQDLGYAGQLYRAMGEQPLADELNKASNALTEQPKQSKTGNGAGSALLGGAAAAFKVLAPLAIKALMPMGI